MIPSKGIATLNVGLCMFSFLIFDMIVRRDMFADIKYFDIVLQNKSRLEASNMNKRAERINFGKHKGKKITDLPDSYLKWMITHLKDSDLHFYAMTAEAILSDRQKDDQNHQSLEQAANDFLRRHGYDPYKL